MPQNAQIAKRQDDKEQAVKRIITEPTSNYWNAFVLDPRFDELLLIMYATLDDQAHYDREVIHLYAHDAGYRQGFRDCLETLRLGAPIVKKETSSEPDPRDHFRTKAND